MGRTISIDLRPGKPASRSKDPERRAEVEAVRTAFLKRPGSVVAVPNPGLPPSARAAVEGLIDGAPCDCADCAINGEPTH